MSARVPRVGGEWDQRPGPLGDSRTLADCCSHNPDPAPTPPPHHDAAAPPAKAPAEPAKYLDLKALALYSRIGIRTLRGYIHRKVRPLPSYQVDKKILIRKVEFDGWLASFRRAEQVDEIDQAVNEMLSGLTGPRPLADTRRHHTRRR
jgi:hypothetical protein